MFVSSLWFLAVVRLWHFQKILHDLVVVGRETVAGLGHSAAAVVELAIAE